MDVLLEWHQTYKVGCLDSTSPKCILQVLNGVTTESLTCFLVMNHYQLSDQHSKSETLLVWTKRCDDLISSSMAKSLVRVGMCVGVFARSPAHSHKYKVHLRAVLFSCWASCVRLCLKCVMVNNCLNGECQKTLCSLSTSVDLPTKPSVYKPSWIATQNGYIFYNSYFTQSIT